MYKDFVVFQVTHVIRFYSMRCESTLSNLLYVYFNAGTLYYPVVAHLG